MTHVKFSPYTFARVAVMKSQLLTKEQYDRILKMGYNEILRVLQDTTYKAEIDRFDVSTQGLKTVEHALNANLCVALQKLHRISQDGMKEVIAAFGLRYDMENVKMIVRAVSSGVEKEEVQPLLYDSLNYPSSLWDNLLAQSSMENVASALPFTIEGTTLFDVENALDKYYTSRMQAFIATLRKKDHVIAGFMRHELLIRNITIILRLHGMKDHTVHEYLISPNKFVKNLASIRNVQDMVTALRNAKLLSLRGDEDDLLVKVEINLEKTLLRKQRKVMHAGLLTPNYILGYLFAKEIEVRNLKALLKGRKLGLSDEFLDATVVTT